ncbi:MAG: hypothetical protein KAV87_65255 [Desulfobacteraceae bacterium]|nr:hypothetical protein [Desulfobacteraceae bacterium]
MENRDYFYEFKEKIVSIVKITSLTGFFICIIGCNGPQTRPVEAVVVVTLGGVSSTDIHGIVDEIAREFGYNLDIDRNWRQDKGDALADDSDAARILGSINHLVLMNGNDRSKLALLVVGKSAGGVLAWNTFRQHYESIKSFQRFALVMVDPHGSVEGDGNVGPYCARQDLWWSSSWSADRDAFRVYNVYQHKVGLTGASFPDPKVFINIQIDEDGINHTNITKHEITRLWIRNALTFAYAGW